VLFQILIPGLTPVLLLEFISRFEIDTQFVEKGKRPLTSIVYGFTAMEKMGWES
jgi:hypothetical protein